jgi:tetratricopeptide (TPR) repeat protein
MWSVAWRDFNDHPLLGGGAGSYEQYWRVHRPSAQEVRDAHSLYMETLAELGIVGLGLLVLTLGIPLLAVRHRAVHLVPFAIGAYAAFLLHAGADWDWEMPAITLTALCCGAAALIAGREHTGRSLLLSARVRYACFALVLILGAFSVETLIGNRDAFASASAAASGNWSNAAAEARSAERWLPWSSAPWRLLGDAEFGQGDFAAAARFYRKAIALDRRNWVLWFDLGFSTDGKDSDAAFARAAALDPLNPDIPRLHREVSHAAP